MIRHIITIAIASSLPAVATANESAPDTLSLPDVAVEAPAKTRITLLPLDVTTVTSEEIDRSAESSLLPVLEGKVAGMFVTERGFAGYGVSGGAAGTVNIRGVGQGNKVLFMIDGQPQWAGVYGHALPDTYVANGVERVEVVKGPSSLLYGSNAMGGSVNIITRRQNKEGLTARARAMFGSYTTERFDVSAGYRRGKVAATVAGSLDRSNGNRAGSEFWLANEFAQLQYAPTEHLVTGATLDLTQTKANNPGTTQSPLLSMWTDVRRLTASVYLKNRYRMASGGIQAYINRGSNRVDDGYAPGGTPRNYLFNSTDYNMGITLYQTFNPWQDNDLSAGIDFQHWGGHTWNTDKENPAMRSAEFRNHVNEVAGYLMMQQGFFSNKLSVNAGVRLQHGSVYGNEWIPQAGLIYRPVTDSELKFSFSKGFRSPNLRELYLYAPANPDLKPEYMLNYEVSYRQHLLGRCLTVGAALYFIDGKDMIQTVPVDGRPRNMNTGSFINKGFELEAAMRFDRRWALSANYAYLHTDAKLLYAPRNKMDAELVYSPSRLRLTLGSSSIWSLHNGNPDRTENYTLLNFGAAYTFKASATHLTAFVKVDNITNRHYEIIYGCPMPGTTILGGIEIKF